MPLLHRVAALNVLPVLATVALTVAVLAPSKISSFAEQQDPAIIDSAGATGARQWRCLPEPGCSHTPSRADQLDERGE